jgi:lysophospholipase L1-like esterase
LACEYRVSNPSLALVMFGTNDVLYLTEADFEKYMRQIVEQSIDAKVLPVLITFPAVPDHMEQSAAYNQIVARLAAEYDVPLVNLYRSLLDNPGYGVDPSHFTRLSYPADGCAACFTDENLQSGITEENLVILSALDAVWQAVKQ